ncbi:hypothetical protein T459_28213 [Capsicum annuum]|uniref:Phosphoribosyltransferase domain-containing protein n=1 Tax=Capsicum annuum TaxID=4072 RepID=A0A2G2YG49_CAPAN|nr:hypothetical protein T459_28213 [Capsicum annuum]
MFVDLEEIFGKNRATREYVEGPLDAVEDILKSQISGISIDMTLGFPINVDKDEDENEDEGSHGPNIATGESENANTGPSFTGASENEYARGLSHERNDTSEKQGEYAKKSSSSVNEKEKSKKRKRVVKDVNETFLKSMTDVIKDFTESQNKRIGALIDKIGNRDHSDMRGQIRGMDTLIRDAQTTKHDFVFYADRLIRLVVEHGLGHLLFTEKQVITPIGKHYTRDAILMPCTRKCFDFFYCPSLFGSVCSGVDFCKRLCGVSVIRSRFRDYNILFTSQLFGTGTISGPEPESYGCLLELTWNG